MVFGERKSDGGPYIAREALSSKAWRTGANELEISQRDLARHLDEMREVAAPRLDGEEWGEITLDGGELAETFEVKCTVGSTFVKAPHTATPSLLVVCTRARMRSLTRRAAADACAHGRWAGLVVAARVAQPRDV